MTLSTLNLTKSLLVVVTLLMVGCASKPYLPNANSSDAGLAFSEGFFQEDVGLVAAAITENTEIRPGFLIHLTQSTDAKLNGTFRVGYDGSLKLPYQVTLQAAGLPLKSLTTKVNESFQKYFKTSPNVLVRIAERKYFIEVRGLVQKPGVFLVSEREKIEDIIKKSGDLSLADEARMLQVIRGENRFSVSLEEYFQGRGMNLSPRWYGGEKVLFVKSSSAISPSETATVQILGDVRTPGGIAYKPGANLYHYLTSVGGTTASSDLDRVQVIRHINGQPIRTSGSAQEVAEAIQLSPGDTVIFGSGLPGKQERQLQWTSTIATVLSAIGILIIAL